jgi:hypothetical protein
MSAGDVADAAAALKYPSREDILRAGSTIFRGAALQRWADERQAAWDAFSEYEHFDPVAMLCEREALELELRSPGGGGYCRATNEVLIVERSTGRAWAMIARTSVPTACRRQMRPTLRTPRSRRLVRRARARAPSREPDRPRLARHGGRRGVRRRR